MPRPRRTGKMGGIVKRVAVVLIIVASAAILLWFFVIRTGLHF